MEGITNEDFLTMLAIATGRFVVTSIDGEEHANLLRRNQSDVNIQKGLDLVQKLILAKFVEQESLLSIYLLLIQQPYRQDQENFRAHAPAAFCKVTDTTRTTHADAYTYVRCKVRRRIPDQTDMTATLEAYSAKLQRGCWRHPESVLPRLKIDPLYFHPVP